MSEKNRQHPPSSTKTGVMFSTVVMQPKKTCAEGAPRQTNPTKCGLRPQPARKKALRDKVPQWRTPRLTHLANVAGASNDHEGSQRPGEAIAREAGRNAARGQIVWGGGDRG